MRNDPHDEAAAAGPSLITKITRGDCAAQVLHAALAARLFDVVDAGGPLTARAVATAAAVDPAFCRDVLDVLVSLGLLERDGTGAYTSNELSRRYLVSTSESFLGGFLDVVRGTVYDTWSRLPAALKDGGAQTQDPDKGGFNGREHRDPDKMRSFLSGLDAISDVIAAQLADDLADIPSPVILDVGGARGHLAARMAQMLPGSSAVVFDLDRTRPLFAEHVTELGMSAQVRFVGGDFFIDRLPGADVAVLGHVLHGLGEAQRGQLLSRVAAAVRPGGRVLVYDRMIGHGRRSADELLGSLHMRLVSAAGLEYSADDCGSWLERAGFSAPRWRPLIEGYTLVSARR